MPERTQIAVEVGEERKRRLAIVAAHLGLTQTEIVNGLLDSWLDKKEHELGLRDGRPDREDKPKA